MLLPKISRKSIGDIHTNERTNVSKKPEDSDDGETGNKSIMGIESIIASIQKAATLLIFVLVILSFILPPLRYLISKLYQTPSFLSSVQTIFA